MMNRVRRCHRHNYFIQYIIFIVKFKILKNTKMVSWRPNWLNEWKGFDFSEGIVVYISNWHKVIGRPLWDNTHLHFLMIESSPDIGFNKARQDKFLSLYFSFFSIELRDNGFFAWISWRLGDPKRRKNKKCRENCNGKGNKLTTNPRIAEQMLTRTRIK